MLQRIHIAPSLIAERRISGTDENHLTVDDLEFVDERIKHDVLRHDSPFGPLSRRAS